MGGMVVLGGFRVPFRAQRLRGGHMFRFGAPRCDWARPAALTKVRADPTEQFMARAFATGHEFVGRGETVET